MNLDGGGVSLDIGHENDDDTEGGIKTTAILRGIAVVVKSI